MNTQPLASDGKGISPSQRMFVTVSVMLASVMQALDNTIANVALPHIQGSLSSTQDQMAWVLTSYIAAAAIMTPLVGWLAEQFGRRRVFLFSIIGFTLTSALCGLAETLPQIVVARLLQGICGAALIPMSQAVLLDINPEEKHARAMSLWVMGITIGPILGPALGGWLTENYNWRWVFYINVPFGILSCLGVFLSMPESRIRQSRFDFFGFATLSLAIGSLQIMLDRGQSQDWFNSTEIWIEAILAALAFYLFIVHFITTKKSSFISSTLLKDRNFVTGNLFIFIVGMVLFATLALLPPLLQYLLDYSVVLTGMVTAPRGLGTLIAMLIFSKFLSKTDLRWVLTCGFLITAYSLWLMTDFYLQMHYSQVVISGLIQGLGTGFVFATLSVITFATLAPEYRNQGTALFSLVRNIGSSIGISIVETLLTRNSQSMHSRLSEQITPYGQHFSNLNTTNPTEHELAVLNQLVSQQASMISYNNNFNLMMILALCAIPLVLLLKKGKTSDKNSVVIE